MSASEKSGQNEIAWTGPYLVPDHPDAAEAYDPDTSEAYGPDAVETYTDMGEPPVLPDPLPEKARTAAQAARGAGNTLWTAVRAHQAAAAGAAASAAAVLTLAYVLGRRARRRRRGPVALLLEGRV
ncbi:hypothetical protein ACFV0D_40010 [Streptomyces sp. NPDC059556]|uniref:hypothetical protein n=1 Tax=Streptomyces sp. NPDC059556 TaxID=3346863 RepID=UPI003698C74F